MGSAGHQLPDPAGDAAFDVKSAAAIDQAARESGVVAMLGYMKRYGWRLEQFCAMLADLPAVRFGRVHDFACRFDKTDYLFDVTVPAAPAGQPPGGSSPSVSEWLLMFASHDFAVERGALGEPEEVTFVEQPGPRTLLIGLRCGANRFCSVELSLAARYQWFDETLTVYGDQKVIGVRFADPFIPLARSSVWAQNADERAVAEHVTTGPFEDAFRSEWRHFAACVASGAAPHAGV